MVHPPPGSHQAPGRLTWSVALDLTDPSSRDAEMEVWSLGNDPRWRSRSITVRVGDRGPHSYDSRVLHGVAEALRNGIDVILDGAPRALTEWWNELRPAPFDPTSRPRHLQVVR